MTLTTRAAGEDLIKSLDSRVKLLRSSPLWSSLSERTLRAIAVAMKPASLAFGETLIHQGDQGSRLYAIVSGGVEVRLRTEGGETVVLAKLGQGECVGEMSLLTGDAASADVVAVNFVECLTLERETFEALIAADQGILREIVRVISSRLKATDKAVGVSVEREKRLSHFIKNDGEAQAPPFLGRHPRMNALRQAIARHAQDSSPVFLSGGPGTGKETVARLIHAAGKRKAGPLLAVECAQIVESPWGDKLFGSYGPGGQSPEFFHAVCYMDLAEGGTLLLMDIDKLPKPIQQRLARFLSSEEWGPEGAPHDVRVIVSSRASLERLAASGQLIGELAEAFKDRVIAVPSLSERKKDIPELAWAFASEHSSRLGKTIKGLDTQAVTRLVSYDYLFGNVRELKEAMERAVVLCEGETIHAEEVFLGVPAKQSSIGFNWLSLPRRLLAFLLAIPKAARIAAALVFALIFFDAFIGIRGFQGRLATLLVWSLWWPCLIVSFLLVGRAWCSVCPMSAAGEGAQRMFGLKWRIPAWMKDYEYGWAAIGFFLIIWAEEVTGMRHSGPATGALLLVILAGAVTSSLLFPRRSWCRHLCPLGGFAGLCSSSSMVELRPTPDVCAAKCTDHACYKGNEKVPGCPVFGHLMFVDSNRDCVLCLNCVQVCPNGSPQLNLRMPGRELWTASASKPEAGMFVAMLSGLLLPLSLLQLMEVHPAAVPSFMREWDHEILTTGLMLAGALLPPLLLRRIFKREGPASQRFWRMMLAWSPMMAAGYASYQLSYVPGIRDVALALSAQGSVGASVPLLALLRTAVLCVGFAVCCIVLWKAARAALSEGRRGPEPAGALAIAAFWVVLLSFAWAA